MVRRPVSLACVLLMALSAAACSVGEARPAGVGDAQTGEQAIRTLHVWDAKVTIADMIMLGKSKHGVRRIIPITGGTFEGPNIRGEVVPGGEDWQLVRPDGDTELYARYLLKTHDGYLIQVINRVLIHAPAAGEKAKPYIRSVIDLEAPSDSPYDYLNHAVFLGTLTQPALKPGEKPYVIIGVNMVLG
jgi:hypothetical protein